MKRKRGTLSSKSKPIYQMCETGGSVEKFLKSSQDNEISGSEILSNKDAQFDANPDSRDSDLVMYGTQHIDMNASLQSKTDVFIYNNQENCNPNNMNDSDPSKSSKSSITDSGVSEGSLIVQDLPKSRIIFATKKSIDKSSKKLKATGVKEYKPKRHNYRPKLSSSKSSIPKAPMNKLPKQDLENSYYDVGSEDSFGSFDESMKIEIEDQT